MRVIKLIPIILMIILFSGYFNSIHASHGMGGEITWQCQPNGAFVFQLKFYRDCNGINAPMSLNMTSTVPGVPAIPMTRIQINDISPQGYFSDGTSPCPNCSAPGGNPGVIQEHIYVSQHVFLNGVPPAAGWDFFWGECCRSNMLSNINNPGSVGFRLKATIFPFNGQNMNPCFDNSPYFIEKPNTVVCTGTPVIYHHIAGDVEFDSLVYTYTTPLTDGGGLVTFSSGYSETSPFPGINSLNSQTGEVYTSNNVGGYFASAIKVSSYKCGIKVAEITREVHVVSINNCPPVFNGAQNTPPELAAPFQDSITGQYTSYADTVIAGDTVNFMMYTTDLQLFNDTSSQIITFNSYGYQYGYGYIDANVGCLIPPCATLIPPPPVVSPLAVTTTFNWVTDPVHLNYSFSCVQFSNTYYFLNKSTDNYCPANGEKARVFSITVLPATPRPVVTNNNGLLECAFDPGYIYQWFFDRWAIPGATSHQHTATQIGTYHVLAVAPDGNGNYSEPFVYNPVGLYENDLSSFSVHPNPGNGIVFISSGKAEQAEYGITVTDVSGRVIYRDAMIAPEHQVDLSRFGKGVMMLQISDQQGNKRFEKLIVY